jgi:hypothetical protein
MGSPSSPLSTLLTQKIAQRLAERGQPGGGAAGVSQPDVAGNQLQQEFQGLSGADPEAAGKMIKSINMVLSRFYVQLIMQVPDAAQDIAAAQKALNKAGEKIQKAAATLNAVRPQIANTAGLPPGFNGPQGEGGMEGM